MRVCVYVCVRTAFGPKKKVPVLTFDIFLFVSLPLSVAPGCGLMIICHIPHDSSEVEQNKTFQSCDSAASDPTPFFFFFAFIGDGRSTFSVFSCFCGFAFVPRRAVFTEQPICFLIATFCFHFAALAIVASKPKAAARASFLHSHGQICIFFL